MMQRNLIAIILFCVILQANAFSYKDAKNWGKTYQECNGKHQSPINLDPPDMGGFPSSSDPTMKFTNFNKLPTNVTIKNNGHTVEVKAHWSGKPPTIAGGPLHKSYVFEKTTFHWAPKAWAVKEGYQDDDYSNKLSYTMDMEMHMFFYKADMKSFEKAETQKGGLAILSIGLNSEMKNPEHLFDNLEKSLHKVKAPNSTAVIPPFRVASLLGGNRKVSLFDYYEGSLDYPPCFESVTWFINESEYAITKTLVNEFRKIKLSDGDVSNLRPPQPLNHRTPKTIDFYNGKDE